MPQSGVMSQPEANNEVVFFHPDYSAAQFARDLTSMESSMATTSATNTRGLSETTLHPTFDPTGMHPTAAMSGVEQLGDPGSVGINLVDPFLFMDTEASFNTFDTFSESAIGEARTARVLLSYNGRPSSLGDLDSIMDQASGLETYWKKFDPMFPVVHRPTFESSTPSPLLRALMINIGRRLQTGRQPGQEFQGVRVVCIEQAETVHT